MKRLLHKTLVLISILTLSLGAIAQKLETPHVNKLTGDTTLRTSVEKLFSKGSWTGTVGEMLFFSLAKTKNLTLLSVKLQTGTTSIFSVREGDELALKFKSGKVLTLKASKDRVSDYTTVSHGSENVVVYLLSEEDITALKAEPIEFIRIQTTRKAFDYNIERKNSEKIKKAAELLF